MSDEIFIKPKSRKFKLFILIAALVIAGLTIAAVILGVTKTATAKKVDKQLSLGEKYLSELKYEQAIAAYEKALKIDPKNTDAYLGLADVYIAMGDYDKAEEILEEAKENIKKAEDKDRIKRKEKRVTKDKETEQKTPPSPTPTFTPTPSPTPSPTPTPTPTLTKAPSSGMAEALKKASVGDYITFGTYEQDNNLSNGAEPIEWLVLEKKDGKALVLSKYALDCKKYNEEYAGVTWETCTLRSWLNDEFYTTAFNKTERSAVVQTLIKNMGNPKYGTEGGNDTKDKVFLLSIDEVTTYFDSDPDAYDPARRAKVTEYAKAQGGSYDVEKDSECYGNGWWWLRSPGSGRKDAAEVLDVGYVSRYGTSVDYSLNVVRPALWIAYAEQESTPTETPSSGKAEALKKASVGDYITFGTYEQDNNLSNGAEPIEWLVLEKKDGKALVLSKYALDAKPYNEEYVNVTWETCTLHSWLNDEFYTTAFNKTERSAVVQTLIKNKDNPVYGTEGGNDTKDKVFLLSIDEVTTYFDSDPDEKDPARGAKVTEYAKAQGGWVYEEAKYKVHGTTEYDGNGWWWLRSPGSDSDDAAGVDVDGYVDRYGNTVVYNIRFVRPALWIAYAEQESTPTETPSSGKAEALKNASVGDYITFGTYEQDNNLSNGAEPIEWLILEKKDGKALVLSKYALNCKKYNEERVDVTWETCTLRSWLNNEFYTTAFNKTERSAVVQTLIKNKDNPVYGTEGGNDTKDKVFLLSIDEVTTYFDSDPDEKDPARGAKVTEYAKAQGGWYYDDKDSEYYGNYSWWLLSPGDLSSNAAVVGSTGYVFRIGYYVDSSHFVVRPALWIAY